MPNPEDRMPTREEIIEALQNAAEEGGHPDPKNLKVNFDMVEDMLVFGLAGGFMHNLNFVDDPLFLEAANATLGTHQDGEPIPQEDLINSKVPMTLTGYGLMNGKGELIGFSCFETQIETK